MDTWIHKIIGNVKTGKRPRKDDPKRPRLARYVNMSTIPEPPAVIKNSRGVTQWGMMGNDLLGDCTCAGIGHTFQVDVLSQEDEGVANPTVIMPDDASIIGLYSAACGYIPGDPSTDNGGIEGDVVKYVEKNGFMGRKFLGAVSIDPTDLHMIQIAIWLFRSVYSGFELPDEWMQESVWDVVKSRGTEGHCMVHPDSDGVMIPAITWGICQPITTAGFTQYCDELRAILTDSVRPVPGFDLEMLKADLVTFGQDN